jgi:hypothetical protein
MIKTVNFSVYVHSWSQFVQNVIVLLSWHIFFIRYCTGFYNTCIKSLSLISSACMKKKSNPSSELITVQSGRSSQHSITSEKAVTLHSHHCEKLTFITLVSLPD